MSKWGRLDTPTFYWKEQFEQWERGFPKLVTFYAQKGRADSKWEELGEWEVDSWQELSRTAQLVQDMANNSRIKGVDSGTGKEDIVLYNR